ncbi:hypothetical protein J2T57_001235 [Natronocella acetinitrilica]|uniref:Uncharacterized protein n=1 Tax=Natronocella acetinitrilica TaxID=414046 RepID=A0AAE3KBV3_9GAMM|nr:hypothetical protein [Natronocella acetinitrilica]MCP1674133.1 hypothetical protein [Natronocella acetinitrilica]
MSTEQVSLVSGQGERRGLSHLSEGLAPLYQINDKRTALRYFRMRVEVAMADGRSEREAVAAERALIEGFAAQASEKLRATLIGDAERPGAFDFDLFAEIFTDARKARQREALTAHITGMAP